MRWLKKSAELPLTWSAHAFASATRDYAHQTAYARVLADHRRTTTPTTRNLQ